MCGLVGDIFVSDDKVAGLHVQSLFRDGCRYDYLMSAVLEVSQDVILLALRYSCK